MKDLKDYINIQVTESKGQPIDDQWINDEKPVQTKDGRQVIITKVDLKEVPNVIYGQVKMKEKLFDYETTITFSPLGALCISGNDVGTGSVRCRRWW